MAHSVAWTLLVVAVVATVLFFIVAWIISGKKNCVFGFVDEIGISRADAKTLIFQSSNTDLLVCSNKCKMNSNCAGFNYNVMQGICSGYSNIPTNPVVTGMSSPSGFYAKSGFCGPDTTKPCTTKINYLVEENVSGGYNVTLYKPDALTETACRDFCTGDPTCQAYRWETPIPDEGEVFFSDTSDPKVCFLGFNGRTGSLATPNSNTYVKYSNCV